MHKSLKSYYEKQCKSSKSLAEDKEEKELTLQYKREDEKEKLTRMEQKRLIREEEHQRQILIKIAEKDQRA